MLGKMPACSNQHKTNMTKSELCKSYREKPEYAGLGELTLAKILVERHPDVFGSVESARSVVRYADRKFKIEKSGGGAPSLSLDLEKGRWGREKSVLEAKYKDALKTIETLTHERDAALGVADFSPRTTIQVESGRSSEAVCCAVLSDWHIEETVNPAMVNGMNEYTLDIAAKRSSQVFSSIARLLKRESSDQKIDTLVVGVIGDMISGNIHTELLENCSLRPMEAMMYCEELIVNGLNFLLENTKVDILVVWRVGNHARITRRIHVSTEQGNNLETVMFHHIRTYFRNNPRVRFEMSDGYLQYTELFGKYNICWQHGHAVQYQGGVGGITIPINKAIAQWQKMKHADLYVMGHWHQFFDGGNFIVNGSLIGYSPYSVFIKAGYESPKQAFFTVNKKWMTKTATYPILFH